MVGESTGNNKGILFILLVLGIVIILFDALGYLNSFKGSLNNAITPIEYFFSQANRQISSTFESFSSISNLRVENDLLKKKIAKLESEEVIVDDIMNENEILRKQLSYKNDENVEYIMARVVSTNHMSDKSFLKIDKGNKDGLEKGDIVVYENNYVGLLYEVFDYTSVVILLDSTKSVILCKTEGNKAEGIVKGTKDGLLFTEVSVTDKIEVNEKIIYYPESISFPLVVGYIEEIFDSPSAPKQTARIETYVPLLNLSHVFIVK